LGATLLFEEIGLYDLETRMLKGARGARRLRPVQARVFVHLMRSASRVVSYESLLNALYPNKTNRLEGSPEYFVMLQTICQLRHMLRDLAVPAEIENVYRAGYILHGNINQCPKVYLSGDALEELTRLLDTHTDQPRAAKMLQVIHA
jgi:DNA-binding winged helix-turn-helix (wHTH) protein